MNSRRAKRERRGRVNRSKQPLRTGNVDGPAPSTRPPIWSELAAGDDGMMSFVNVVTVGLLALLVGFVGNVGQMVQEKIAVQTAADATAYSASLVMARGMNAVTATNHLLGEATALVVLLDALGVPGDSDSSTESPSSTTECQEQYSEISTSSETAACIAVGFTSLDEEFLNQAQSAIADSEYPKSGAMCYDATLQLRKCYLCGLVAKDVGNTVLLAQEVPIIGEIAYVVGLGIHIAADIAILGMIKEGYVLEFAQEIIPNLSGFKSALRRVVIPAVSVYSDTIVGSATKSDANGSTSPFIGQALRQTVDLMKTKHDVSEIALYPAIDTFRLPVVPEDPPQDTPPSQQSSQNSPDQKPQSLWEGRDQGSGAPYEILQAMVAPVKYVEKLVDRVNDWIDQANKFTFGVADAALKAAHTFVDGVGALLGKFDMDPKPTPELGGVGFPQNPSADLLTKRPSAAWDREARSQWVRATYPAVDSMRAPLRRLLKDNLPFSQASTFFVHWTNRFALETSWELRSGHPEKTDSAKNSNDKSRLRQLLATLQQELAQLRAKFDFATDGPGALMEDREIPGNAYLDISTRLVDVVQIAQNEIQTALDALPAGVKDLLLKWMQDVLGHNDAIGAIVQQVQSDPEDDLMESDFRDVVEDLARVEKLDELLKKFEEILGKLENLVDLFDLPTPHMYVMLDLDDPLNKGYEIWTASSAVVEKRFAVLAIAHRSPHAARFVDSLFKLDANPGITATAQAMYYNANGRNMPIQKPANSDTQPDTGWDTLNWQPPVRAPEWGSSVPTEPNGQNPLDLVNGSLQPSESARIQLNWQAKLVPVSKSRLRAARQDSKWKNIDRASPAEESAEKQIIRH